MLRRQHLLICSLVLAAGCSYQVREQSAGAVQYLSAIPFDTAPPSTGPDEKLPAAAPPTTDVKTTAYMQEPPLPAVGDKKPSITVPAELPGSEAGLIPHFENEAQKKAGLQRLYPKLPELPEEPQAQPGPGGQAFTFADRHQLAAANSPALMEAAAAVQTARGNR